MKLLDVIKGIGVKKVKGGTEKEITELVIDSNSVTPGSLYICLKGKDFDGHDFIGRAEKYGASAIMCDRETDTPLTQVIVEDTRAAMSLAAANFYGNPGNKLKLIAVTGTNGKTTTTHFITSILAGAGIKCGLIGTLGTYYADKYIEPSLTTPDPVILHKTLADMYESGVDTVVMEVSAHAAYHKKAYGLKFESAVFTNLTQDHLDFFGSMEEYKRAKFGFFRDNACKYIVTNSDDVAGAELAAQYKNAITYGIENPADVFAIKVAERKDGTTFVMNLFDRIFDVKLHLIGRFNVYNALAAATAAALFGVSTEKAAEGLSALKGVNGRLECVYTEKFSVYVDYAHTPDGLEKSLSALKKVCRGRLISVFGCGGNRDEKKRRVMGEVSGRLADFTVITTDNPRFEDAMDIIWEIEKGVLMHSSAYVIVQDRAEAVKYAVNSAGEGDVVLIAGKGAEKYQEVFGIKRPYNDKDTVEEILRGRKG